MKGFPFIPSRVQKVERCRQFEHCCARGRAHSGIWATRHWHTHCLFSGCGSGEKMRWSGNEKSNVARICACARLTCLLHEASGTLLIPRGQTRHEDTDKTRGKQEIRARRNS